MPTGVYKHKPLSEEAKKRVKMGIKRTHDEILLAKKLNYQKNIKMIKKRSRKFYQQNKVRLQLGFKKYYAKNRMKRIKKWYFDNYKVDLEDIVSMYNKQNKKCLICGCKMVINKGCVAERTCLDHDHIPKKIRGLLCINCNIGLGCFKDSPHLLMSAFNYLKKHEEK